MYANPAGLTETVSFRCHESVGHLVRGAAARQGEFVSEWLRRVVLHALEDELGASVSVPTIDAGNGIV